MIVCQVSKAELPLIHFIQKAILLRYSVLQYNNIQPFRRLQSRTTKQNMIKLNGTNFSDQFKKIIKRYIRVGYNLDIMRQSACLVLNTITVYSYGFLFNGQASDSMTALT